MRGFRGSDVEFQLARWCWEMSAGAGDLKGGFRLSC